MRKHKAPGELHPAPRELRRQMRYPLLCANPSTRGCPQAVDNGLFDGSLPDPEIADRGDAESETKKGRTHWMLRSIGD
jgi:hypothetical protein